ncbi:hypothetical protein [Streptomyces antarcticus]|uniref:hypothetical protein n=1 Tax=Streptomyces antarcticus TaxID=2996458 RepID=UPI00226D709B|nr:MULTISPECIES: hypothetical protein [unclassified Streptomyces]MCY0942615.1 hypothetical protein [Streptomyces sp. H34-AA3]MCZ4081361.1 hypothetical protein [Streptomyces sp. H34-S5]
MKPEEVFRWTAEERAELEAGWVDMLAAQEAAVVSAAIREAAPVLVQRAVREARRRRSRGRRVYDFAARFTGPLMVFMIFGSVGLFLGAAAVMQR